MPTPTPSADRNLLFGLLALQMDFLTRDHLLEAMNAWMLEKGTPLGEILCRRGVLAEDDRTDIDRIVEKHVKRHGGDAQASLAAVRVEAKVRASLAALVDADIQSSLAQSRDDAHELSSSAARVGTPSGVRFRRLREHDRGNLGVVYVAHDEELHREVALKEIKEDLARHQHSRARFVREAEITGHLQHPGVVPIYGLGAYADGQPFYAMRFIHGETLHEAIKRFHAADERRRDPGERSLALRELLTRFIGVCNAVAYAHARGVIHRDLKPANVMIGEFGETLILDWGLARLLDKEDPDATTPAVPVVLSDGMGSTLTELGQVVGTPAYMSPEQALGKHDEVGPSSDVFSLGAILYTVLTGEAPYTGDASEVLSQAKCCEVQPARQRKGSVARALEAVCAKAMAASAKDRYSAAKALADEVQRWLADEPVGAYREPLSDRVRRWGKRNRTLVSVGVALLLASLVGLGLGLWFVNAERTRTEQQRRLAVKGRIEAETNLARALKAEALAKENVNQAEAKLPGERPGRPEGSGRSLSEPQAARIRRLIDANTPEKLGIPHALWTRRAVGELIRKEFDIALAERTVGLYLRRWGYTPKKPARHAKKQDPDDVKEWLEETYPGIEERALEEDAEILWCDEVGAAADAHPGTGYAREGERATMEVPPPHIRVNQISAISNEGAVRFMTYKGTLNAALFLVFLGKLIEGAGRKIFLIVDSLQAHKTPEVAAWVEAHKGQLEVFYLPTYSPELNPVEYLNNDMKGEVNKAGLPDDRATLHGRIVGFMTRLAHLPTHVISYFLHPCVQYAAPLEL
jgi:serine/threonine protein kinase/transposase